MRSIAVILCVLALHSATAQRNSNSNPNENRNGTRKRRRRRQRNLQEYKNFADPISPDNCIENDKALIQHLQEYYKNGRRDSLSGMNYGHPIQQWCVGPDLEAKLRKNLPLRNHVSTAVQASTKDAYDAFDDADANKLMDDWIAAASGSDCLELCGVMDGEFGDAFADELRQEEEEEPDYLHAEHEAMKESIDSETKDQEMLEELLDSMDEGSAASKGNTTATAATQASFPISMEEETELDEPDLEEEYYSPMDSASNNNGDNYNYVYNNQNTQGGQNQQEQTEPMDSTFNNNNSNQNYYAAENNNGAAYNYDYNNQNTQNEQNQQGHTEPVNNNNSYQNYYAVENTQESEEEDRAESMDIDTEDFDITSNENEQDEWVEWEEEAVHPTDYSSYSNQASQQSNIAVSRNKTTTAMLLRLIPIKLCVLLAFMCLVLGIRQMILNSDRDHCCGKFGAILGFQSGGHVAYQGIDPSDVEESQKSVEFELLQLAASGDAFEDEDLDVDIGTDILMT